MVYKNEKTAFFDVDSTLVKQTASGELRLELYGVPNQYKALTKNAIQIGTHLKRGWIVFIWSNNGPEWAEQVVRALGYNPDDLIILNKPMKIFDDEDASAWMPKRVHLHEDEIK